MRVRETGKEKKRKTPACCFSADEMGLFGVACTEDLYPSLSDSGLGVDGNSAACVSGWLGMLWGVVRWALERVLHGLRCLGGWGCGCSFGDREEEMGEGEVWGAGGIVQDGCGG